MTNSYLVDIGLDRNSIDILIRPSCPNRWVLLIMNPTMKYLLRYGIRMEKMLYIKNFSSSECVGEIKYFGYLSDALQIFPIKLKMYYLSVY
jgi:hypothetical protein